MKCPLCKREMEKGNLLGHGTTWGKTKFVVGMARLFAGDKPEVIAYKCPQCGKVELYTAQG